MERTAPVSLKSHARPLRVRLPHPLLHTLDRFAEATGQTRSATVRFLLAARLAELGLWPPVPEDARDAA